MRELVLKLTAGIDDPERVSQAFAVAAASIAVGAKVSVWLAGDATWLGVAGRAEEIEIEFGPDVATIRDQILESATLTVCGPCASRRELAPENFLPGIRIAGATAFVEEALNENAQALVY